MTDERARPEPPVAETRSEHSRASTQQDGANLSELQEYPNPRRDCVVGIVGINGQFGSRLKGWFEAFGSTVIGSDLTLPEGLNNRQVVEKADVVVFAVSIAATPKVIAESGPGRPGQMWMDITSVKAPAIDAMLNATKDAQCDVFGLHPMVGPTVPNLRGQKVAIYVARNYRWLTWLHDFLDSIGVNESDKTEIRRKAEHDESMAFIQALPHAVSMLLAATLCERKQDPKDLLKYSTPAFRLAFAAMARLFSQPADVYMDIQFENTKNTVPALEAFRDQLDKFIGMVKAVDKEAGKKALARELVTSKSHLSGVIDEWSLYFDKLSHLMTDLGDSNCFLLMGTHDEAGLLNKVLDIFARHSVNLRSLHSFPALTPGGTNIFRLSMQQKWTDANVRNVIRDLQARKDIGFIPSEPAIGMPSEPPLLRYVRDQFVKKFGQIPEQFAAKLQSIPELELCSILDRLAAAETINDVWDK